jgi:hypothetical protein
MKLLHCWRCGDVKGLLIGTWRRCECRKSRGRYIPEEGKNSARMVEFSGPCQVLGILNEDLREAVPSETKGIESPTHGWWVIGDHSEFTKRKGKKPERNPAVSEAEINAIMAMLKDAKTPTL